MTKASESEERQLTVSSLDVIHLDDACLLKKRARNLDSLRCESFRRCLIAQLVHLLAVKQHILGRLCARLNALRLRPHIHGPVIFTAHPVGDHTSERLRAQQQGGYGEKKK